ncbi:MAG: LemA family protein [Candidatus Diapherotrites archaeon]|uniref:LemA family protein n=1 Tax=Candidatus Iainarchaeum sp. TaxID=3101447 RepID=A0A8T5GF02_9ARCH|nr:LemA family protein [Candidatus Diapherotrites archaeon]MBT7240933.1 LemA family protein [Candidatus Diapherotrites archaeon]
MELLFIIGIPVLILIILAVILIAIYNSLVVTEKQVDNSWAQIDVQLKRRADLIPNLVETVKGYAKFEQRVLTEVTKARTAILSAKTPKDAAKGDNMLAGALKTIFAVAESYPALKANESFLKIQEELSSTENKVAFARQFYNDMVMKWNTMIATFPTSIVAGMFGKKKDREFFEANEAEKKNVKVDFSDLSK